MIRWMAPFLLAAALLPRVGLAGDITESNTKNETNGDTGCDPGCCSVDGECVPSDECCDDPGSPTSPPTSDAPGQPAGVAGQMGNPIDVRNGNKFHREVIYQGGGEMPLLFELFYNSKHITTGLSTVKAIGQWTHTFSSHLRVPGTGTSFPGNVGTGGQTVELRRPDGQSLFFKEKTVPAVGYFKNETSETDGYLAVTELSGGSPVTYTEYQYERPDGDIEVFNSTGELTEIRSRQGGKITLARTVDPLDPQVAIVTVTRSRGGEMRFKHLVDSSGHADDSCFRCPTAFKSPDASDYSYFFGHVDVSIPNNGTGPATRKLIKSVTYPSDPTDDPGTHIVNFEYEKTAASYPSFCPSPWECQTALTGIIDEEGRRWATWDYRHVMPIVQGAQTVHHMAWGYLGYHGTVSEKEDHVEAQQLVLTTGTVIPSGGPRPADPRTYDDKFLLTTAHAMKEVYNFNHTDVTYGGATEFIPPRVDDVRDLRFWDPGVTTNAPNVEQVNRRYEYYRQTEDRRADKVTLVTSPTDTQDIDDRAGLMKWVIRQGAGEDPADRVKVEYDYYRDEDQNNVPDRLLARKTESGGAEANETIHRVTDYVWDTGLRKPSQITVSRDGTTGTREYVIAYSYTNGRKNTVTTTDFTAHTDPYPTNGRTRVVGYNYTYYSDSNFPNTRVQTMQVDGARPGSGDTTTFNFTSNGFMESVVDAEGNSTSWSGYNGRGQPSSRTDPDGTVTSFVFNKRGWIRSRTVGSATWEYRYYRNGLIKRIDFPNGDYQTFTYNSARKLLSIGNSFGDSVEYARVFEVNGSGNRTGTLRIDTSVRKAGVVVATASARYDARGRLMESSGPAGQKTRYTYELVDRLKTIVEDGFKVTPTSTTTESLTTTFNYDGLDRVESVTMPEAGTPFSSEFTYNVRNQLTRVRQWRDVPGSTSDISLDTNYVMDGFGELIRRVNPEAGTTDYTYDNAGNLISDSQSLGGGVTTSRTRTYDDANRLKTETASPTGAVHTWFYDEGDTSPFENRTGRLSRVVDSSGETILGYDEFGRVNRERQSTNSSLPSPTVFDLIYDFDAVGNLESITYPSGRVVDYARTSGRVDSATLSVAHPQETGGTLASLAEYFAFGPIDRFTYGNGLVLDRERDISGRLGEYVISPDGLPGTAGQVLSRLYQYDAFDQVQTITDSIDTLATQNFTYDRRHRVNIATGRFGEIDYDYDSTENRVRRRLRSTSEDPWTTELFVPELGSNRLYSVNVTPADPLVQSYTRSLFYDTRGNVTRDERSSIQRLEYQYNNRNQMKSVLTKVVPEPGLPWLIASGVAMLAGLHPQRCRRKERQSVAWRMARRIVACLAVVSALGLVAATSAQAQCAGDLDCDQIPDTYEDSTIDGNNLTLDLNKNQANDAAVDFDQDGLSNRAEYLNGNSSFSFRDPLVCGPQSAPASQCHPIIQTFVVDKTSVLESGDVIVSWTTLHTVGAGRQLRVEPFGVIPAADALSGSRTLTINASTFFTMFASNENATKAAYREVEVFTEIQANTYNAANQRVRKTAGSIERLFVYGPDGEILAETTENGTPVVEYVYLEGQPIAQIHGAGATSQKYYVHNSHLGTPELMTDAAKAVVWKIETGPFGEVQTEGVFGSTVTQRTRFPGQIADSGAGLNYNWHRYYDPSIGRYISADPIGQEGGINLFTYAKDNPISTTDPLGLEPPSEATLRLFKQGAQARKVPMALSQANSDRLCDLGYKSCSIEADDDNFEEENNCANLFSCARIGLPPGPACDAAVAAYEAAKKAGETPSVD